MTNSEIIFRESLRLMEEGVLSGCGQYGTFIDENGTERKIELPEPIHTFATWKKAGYIVKKGQHAVASFPVWKYAERRQNADQTDEESASDEEQVTGRMFMKKAFFFKMSQVERITA